MNEFRELLRYAHVGFGFTGLVAFWIPVFRPRSPGVES